MGSTASAADRAPPLLESEAAPPTSRPSATESTALMASSQQPEGKGGKAKKVSYDAIEGLRPILMVMVMLAHYNPTRAAVDRLNAGSMQPPSVTSMWWDTLFDRGGTSIRRTQWPFSSSSSRHEAASARPAPRRHGTRPRGPRPRVGARAAPRAPWTRARPSERTGARRPPSE